MIIFFITVSGILLHAYHADERNRKDLPAFCMILLVIQTGLISCQKGGREIPSPSFGQLSIHITSPVGASTLLIRIDGAVRDTLKEGTHNLFIETGERRLTITDLKNAAVLDTTIIIQLRSPVALTGLYTGYAVLLDNPDPGLKPQPDSLLIRFVTTDRQLPDRIDIVLSLYDFAGTHIPLDNKVVKGIRKDKFSEYIQLADPEAIHPDYRSFYYVIEAYDTRPGREYKKVMSIEESTVSFLDYSGDFSYTWIPNNIISFGIGPAPADGSTGIRNPQLIFQRTAP